MEDTMDPSNADVARTRRARHDSKLRVDGDRQATGSSSAAIYVGHKLMSEESVEVGARCRVAGAGNSLSLGVSDTVAKVA